MKRFLVLAIVLIALLSLIAFVPGRAQGDQPDRVFLPVVVNPAPAYTTLVIPEPSGMGLMAYDLTDPNNGRMLWDNPGSYAVNRAGLKTALMGAGLIYIGDGARMESKSLIWAQCSVLGRVEGDSQVTFYWTDTSCPDRYYSVAFR